MPIRLTIVLLVMSLAVLPTAHAQPDAPIPAVYYTTEPFDYKVATLDRDTFQLTEVCAVDGHTLTNGRPAPSPDGRALALTLFSGQFFIADFTFLPTQQNSFIYHCDLATGEAARLSLPTESILDSSPSFSPDRTQLAWLRVVTVDDEGTLQSQVVVYDVVSATETVIATLDTVPMLGITDSWVDWGAGGIAVNWHPDFTQTNATIDIYTATGELLASTEHTARPANAVYEWALLGEQPVYMLSVEPSDSRAGDNYAVLNPTTGAVETITGNPTKTPIQTESSGPEPIQHDITSPQSNAAFLGQRVEVGLLSKRYHNRYDFAADPDGTRMFVIEYSELSLGGLLYHVDGADLGFALGAFVFPITPIDLPNVAPGMGGTQAVYWQPDVWQFEAE